MSAIDASALLSTAGGIPIAPCPSCEREVIAYLRPLAAGEGPPRDALAPDGETYACTACDRPLRGVTLVEEADLAELGYDVADPAAGGCATGCAAGGCAPPGGRLAEMLERAKRDRPE
jgi:hypothetical protein